MRGQQNGRLFYSSPNLPVHSCFHQRSMSTCASSNPVHTLPRLCFDSFLITCYQMLLHRQLSPLRIPLKSNKCSCCCHHPDAGKSRDVTAVAAAAAAAASAREETRMTTTRPALACCKLYISEARSTPALRAIERAAAALRPAVVLLNAFADDAYNRVGYTLVSRLPAAGGGGGGGGGGDPAPPPPLHRAAFGVVAAALEAVDLGAHAGAHPRLGVVDHVAFHPLAGARLDDVAALARAVAADIGDKLQVPTYLYGAAHSEGRTLAAIRRQLGYFTPNSPGEQWRGSPEASALAVAPDAGPATASSSTGVAVIGATAWVDNYNVPLHTGSVGAAKKIARAVSERGGGLRAVQAMGLAHGEGVTEVACNLLDPAAVGAEQVQERVRQLAAARGLAVWQGYFTDFSQEKVVELYLQSAEEAEG